METVRPPKRSNLYHITCGNLDCDAVLECSKEELELTHDYEDYEGSSLNLPIYRMNCPHCLRATIIQLSELTTSQVGY